MEGTLLERVYLTGVVSGALGKYPQLDLRSIKSSRKLIDNQCDSRTRFYLLVPNLLRGGVEHGSRFLGIHSVDEDQTAQPCAEADRPRIEDLLFGDDSTFVHHRPQIKHPQYIQRALMIRHDYASPVFLQVFPASELPAQSQQSANVMAQRRCQSAKYLSHSTTTT